MEKQKALDMALSQIEKQFGKGAVMKLGEKSVNQGIEVISTGCLELDFALGVGGFPRGRIIEICAVLYLRGGRAGVRGRHGP